MYAITGATGHVGGAAADTLIAAGHPVRAVVRGPERGAALAARGAEIAVADFADRAALAAALTGCHAAFLLLPVIPDGTDADHRRMADTIAGAVADSGVPHVVLLSSWGADLAEGNGPVRWLHHLEGRLRETGVVLTALRSPHFQEKVEEVLGAVRGAGVYPVFRADADEPVTMVATRDIGAAAAEALLAAPRTGEVVDLDAPAYSERQVAEALGALLGTKLDVVVIPREGWLGALTGAGLPPLLAAELVDLYDAEQRGVIRPRGDRRVRCATTLDETLRAVLG